MEMPLEIAHQYLRKKWMHKAFMGLYLNAYLLRQHFRLVIVLVCQLRSVCCLKSGVVS